MPPSLAAGLLLTPLLLPAAPVAALAPVAEGRTAAASVVGSARPPAASLASGVAGSEMAGSGGVEPAPSRDGVWPLAPRPAIDRGFVPPASRWGAGHRGVDLVGRPGQAVHTSLAGTVVFAAVLAGRGVVVVEHGGLRTTYEPVDAVVRVGDVVGRGEVLGQLRTAGSHCFPRACLHWGLRRGTAYLDPLVLVGLGPLRLLPAPAGVGSGWASGPALGPSARVPQGGDRALVPGPAPTPPFAAVRRPLPWWVTDAGPGSGARVGLAVGRAQTF